MVLLCLVSVLVYLLSVLKVVVLESRVLNVSVSVYLCYLFLNLESVLGVYIKVCVCVDASYWITGCV